MASETRMDCDVEQLIRGSGIHCPWCHKWGRLEVFIQLRTPPDHLNECPPIYKHGGVDGCKGIFAIFQRG